ncbi:MULTISPECIES: hypothetical protein [Streptomyces]|uniref:hypothetical protein n=1 Tax=Streptomyces TaxID=1883 RepID=UPI0004C77B83|nr:MULTISPECIES: hypothetical protein [unclassified Streptomyces]SEC13766.1 hypothetical protein SAMN05428938_1342 [Streptomyces sp. KS_5]SED28980.1 hypothetical protein SAMN05216482_6817 [Streptomyces sp. PAN_FS17]
MAQWVVVVQSGYGEQYMCEEAARFQGTREEARARLYEIACTYKHRSGLRQKHREVFRLDEGDGYYAVVQGRMTTHRVLFRLAERVWSTDPEPKTWE